MRKRQDKRICSAVLFLLFLFLAGLAAGVQEILSVREESQPDMMELPDEAEKDSTEVLRERGAAVLVRISAGNLRGSGVIFGSDEENLVILTAAHVLEDAGSLVKVTFADGWEIDSGDFCLFEGMDLAAVRIPRKEITEEHMKDLRRVCVERDAFDKVSPEDRCLVMGIGEGGMEVYVGTVTDSWIYMEDYGQYMIWAKADVTPGMSGGGLFDMEGHFLGIISGGSDDGELAAVPLSLILAADLFP